MSALDEQPAEPFSAGQWYFSFEIHLVLVIISFWSKHFYFYTTTVLTNTIMLVLYSFTVIVSVSVLFCIDIRFSSRLRVRATIHIRTNSYFTKNAVKYHSTIITAQSNLIQYTNPDSLSMLSFSFWHTHFQRFHVLRPATHTRRKFFRRSPETLVQTADLVQAQLVCCTVSVQWHLGVFPLVWTAAITESLQWKRKTTALLNCNYPRGTSIRDARTYRIRLRIIHIYQLLDICIFTVYRLSIFWYVDNELINVLL